MKDAAAQIREFHAAYVQHTGYAVPLNSMREQQWFEWVRRGYNTGEVVALIKDLQWKAKNGIPARSLKFHNFVGQVDYVEEDIAELRARGRCHATNPHKEEVLRATGRASTDGAPEPIYAKPSAEIIRQLRAAAGLNNDDSKPEMLGVRENPSVRD